MRRYVKVLTAIMLTASVFSVYGITSYAENSIPAQESSEFVSVPEQTEPSAAESSYMSDMSEPSEEISEPLYESEPSSEQESSAETSEPSCVQESSEESSETSYVQEPYGEPSEPSNVQESSYETSEPVNEFEPSEEIDESEPISEPEISYEPPESSAPSIVDPFAGITGGKYILPADNPEFSAPESSIENESSAESSTEAAAIIDDSSRFDSTPSIEYDEHSAAVTYNSEKDNSSFLVGMIIWSVIGVIVTAVLIVILNLKGDNTEFAFSRKRYHKGLNHSAGTNKYNIY